VSIALPEQPARSILRRFFRRFEVLQDLEDLNSMFVTRLALLPRQVLGVLAKELGYTLQDIAASQGSTAVPLKRRAALCVS
jgi:hypothetical protein